MHAQQNIPSFKETIEENKNWIPASAAAAKLNRSMAQIHRYIEDGTLRARRIGDRGWWRVHRDDVAAHAAKLGEREPRAARVARGAAASS